MASVYTQVVSRKGPEDTRQTPVVTLRRITTAQGAVTNDTIIDSFLTGLTDSPVGLTLVRRPDDPLRFEVRSVTAFNAVTGETTVGVAFSSRVAAGEQYGICSLQTGGGSGSVAVPAVDSLLNAFMHEVVGNKGDTAIYVSAATRSLMSYLKGVVNQFGNISGHTLVSLAAKFGDGAESLLTVLGLTTTAADQTTGAASAQARLRGLLTSLGNPAADTLTTIVAKLGNMAVSLATKTEPVRTAANFSYLDAGGEQTVFTVAPPAGQTWEVSFIGLDVNALTQNSNVRIKKRIDGATFRTINGATGVLVLATEEGAFETGAYVVDNTSQLQVTMAEVADEGAARTIPYEYYYRRLV